MGGGGPNEGSAAGVHRKRLRGRPQLRARHAHSLHADRIDRLVERWQPHAALAARYLYRFRNPAKNK